MIVCFFDWNSSEGLAFAGEDGVGFLFDDVLWDFTGRILLVELGLIQLSHFLILTKLTQHFHLFFARLCVHILYFRLWRLKRKSFILYSRGSRLQYIRN